MEKLVTLVMVMLKESVLIVMVMAMLIVRTVVEMLK
jgi:hypothetical protein